MSYFKNQIKTHVLLIIRQGGEHSRYYKQRWVQAVRTGKTTEGYAEWVATQVTDELYEVANGTQLTTPAPAPLP
ncbi:hypothetical protein [Pseudomonas phage Bertil]|uniref:Uncharacterized protein n=1 Tax=Pseudomonas phage Bertil TaxID=2801385 RepID=A0A7T8EQJ5_9CAUD|nr:hypothetical protein [Pseudomonas phage Bertil]QQO90888.1 hypothetical protein [Pseudomonas phage Strit]